MCRNDLRVMSFSMIEMLVVLVLSSMIVGMVYSAYYTISRYQLTLTQKYTRQGDLASVYFVLQRDFDRSQKIETLKEPNILRCTYMDRLEILYRFTPELVIRKQASRVDSFQCVANRPVFYFEQKEIRQQQASPVDEMRMEMTSLPDPAWLIVRKMYDAASRIELTENDTLP